MLVTEYCVAVYATRMSKFPEKNPKSVVVTSASSDNDQGLQKVNGV